MVDTYISVEAFTAAAMERSCKDCERRKGKKNGKKLTLYEIGEAPCRACGIMDMMEDVEAFPPADVRPAIKGEWTYIAHLPFGHDYECSVCKQRNYESSNFCPNCGAIMRDNPVIIGFDMGGEDG